MKWLIKLSAKVEKITVVGDEDQVVYSFRGASKYNISAFRDTYSQLKDYREITLAENFSLNTADIRRS